jgi:hypothetical protein
MPAWITSLLRELIPEPMQSWLSTTMTVLPAPKLERPRGQQRRPDDEAIDRLHWRRFPTPPNPKPTTDPSVANISY